MARLQNRCFFQVTEAPVLTTILATYLTNGGFNGFGILAVANAAICKSHDFRLSCSNWLTLVRRVPSGLLPTSVSPPLNIRARKPLERKEMNDLFLFLYLLLPFPK
ncbi:hypothetical protein SPLC1_S011210 [Arthrospira platensis C1]|nr:hypothetical protein SPLC1_S011210 [Arthrospira platensis C1]